MINVARRGTVDLRAVNLNDLTEARVKENMTLALQSAKYVALSHKIVEERTLRSVEFATALPLLHLGRLALTQLASPRWTWRLARRARRSSWAGTSFRCESSHLCVGQSGAVNERCRFEPSLPAERRRHFGTRSRWSTRPKRTSGAGSAASASRLASTASAASSSTARPASKTPSALSPFSANPARLVVQNQAERLPLEICLTC